MLCSVAMLIERCFNQARDRVSKHREGEALFKRVLLIICGVSACFAGDQEER